MKHDCPLPDILRNGWIGPLREPVAYPQGHRERLRVVLIQDLVETGGYTIDPGRIARSVLAAAKSARRH